MGFYSCPYIFIDGRICGKGCYRQEGCALHWKIPLRTPCGECGIPTTSSYGMCIKHSGKYRRRVNYHQKKQAELHEKLAMFGNNISDLPNRSEV